MVLQSIQMSQLVDKLRQERAERLRKQAEELAAYDKELKEKREQRLKNKLQSQPTSTNTLLKALETSLQKVQLDHDAVQYQKDVLAKDLQNKQLEREIQVDKWSEMRRKDRLKHMDLTLRSQLHGNTLRIGRSRPRKFEINPGEFYDLDFSNNAQYSHLNSYSAAMRSIMERDEELVNLFRMREDALLEDPELIKNLIAKGHQFVKGMRDNALNKKDNSAQNGLKFKRRGSRLNLSRSGSTGLTTVQESDEVAIDPLMESVIKEGEILEAFQQHDSVENFIQSLSDISKLAKAQEFENKVQDTANQPSTQVDSIQKTSTTTVREKILKSNPLASLQKIDYSDYFPSSVGHVDGIFVFRIEKLKPKLVKTSTDVQKFSIGDCYIVLYVFVNQYHDLDWKIYQWIGAESSLDKKACSAIFSVGLRDLLPATSTNENGIGEITRQSSNEDSSTFLNVFRGAGIDVEIISADKAVPSGLQKIEERQWPLLCYRLYSQKIQTGQKDQNGSLKNARTSGRMKLDLVAPDYRLFDSTQVYVVDTGMIVYQWNGQHSALNDRTKAMFFCNQIVQSERHNVVGCKYEEILQGEEHQAFMMNFEDDLEADESYDIATGNNPVLYIVSQDTLSKLKRKQPGFSIDQLKVPEDKLLRKSMLNSDTCVILDCYAEVYLWIGKNSLAQVRLIAENYIIGQVYSSLDRPPHTSSQKMMDGVESEAFKARFAGWDEGLVRQTNFSSSLKPQTKDQDSLKEQLKIDIGAIFTPHPTGKISRQEEEMYEDIFMKANRLLVSCQVYAFDDAIRKFVRLSNWSIGSKDTDPGREFGHFWSEDSLIFLCIYNKVSQKEADDDTHVSSDDMNPHSVQPSQECVTYVWTGRDVQMPSLASLIFAHSFKNQISSLVYQMSNGKIQVRFVQIIQERESLALCSHYGRQQVIHLGKRKDSILLKHNLFDAASTAESGSFNPANVSMFHIRLDAKYKISRAIQVNPMLSSLCTRDIFFVSYSGPNGTDSNNKENSFLWVGKGASKDEEKAAQQMALKIIRVRADLIRLQLDQTALESALPFAIVKEKIEPRQFWTLIAPTFEKPVASKSAGFVTMGQGYYYSLPPPRLFKCSTATGSFMVTEITRANNTFSISDLTSYASGGEESVFWLDSGPGRGKPYLVYVWIGKRASDVVIKLTKKTLDTYLEHWGDKRSLNNSEWDSSSLKKAEFKNTATGVLRQDVIIVKQNQEPDEFRAFFHGWGAPYFIDAEVAQRLNVDDVSALVDNIAKTKKHKEPSNAFLRGELREGKLVSNE